MSAAGVAFWFDQGRGREDVRHEGDAVHGECEHRAAGDGEHGAVDPVALRMNDKP